MTKQSYSVIFLYLLTAFLMTLCPLFTVSTVHSVTAEYARGVGLIEKSSYTLSVQFLNRVSYVTDLVRERNLLSNLSRCLLETMRGASFVPGSPGAPRPAGASLDMMNDLNGRMRASSSLTIALMGLLGFFSVDDVDDEENIARLDMEMDDIFHNLFGGAGGGGDSRQRRNLRRRRHLRSVRNGSGRQRLGRLSGRA